MTSRPNRWLVYCSAGDRASIESWAVGPREFDVFLSYYGDHPGRYGVVADRYEARRGMKFPNLWAWRRQDPAIFEPYEAVLVLDDDLALSAGEIAELFRLRARHDLWVLQPAFAARGKVSWDVTRQRPWCELRFTNFVENGAPLFAADRLWTFLDDYDGSLMGFGVDYWFLASMDAPAHPTRVAVIDSVVTRNPTNRDKGGTREVDATQTPQERVDQWEWIRDQRGIPTYLPATVGRIRRPVRAQITATIVASPDLAYWAYDRLLGRSRRRAVRHGIYRRLRPLRKRWPFRILRP